MIKFAGHWGAKRRKIHYTDGYSFPSWERKLPKQFESTPIHLNRKRNRHGEVRTTALNTICTHVTGWLKEDHIILRTKINRWNTVSLNNECHTEESRKQMACTPIHAVRQSVSTAQLYKNPPWQRSSGWIIIIGVKY